GADTIVAASTPPVRYATPQARSSASRRGKGTELAHVVESMHASLSRPPGLWWSSAWKRSSEQTGQRINEAWQDLQDSQCLTDTQGGHWRLSTRSTRIPNVALLVARPHPPHQAHASGEIPLRFGRHLLPILVGRHLLPILVGRHLLPI